MQATAKPVTCPNQAGRKPQPRRHAAAVQPASCRSTTRHTPSSGRRQDSDDGDDTDGNRLNDPTVTTIPADPSIDVVKTSSHQDLDGDGKPDIGKLKNLVINVGRCKLKIGSFIITLTKVVLMFVLKKKHKRTQTKTLFNNKRGSKDLDVSP